MDDYISKLKGDLAEQFRGKANIESLLEVLGSELQQVYAFYEKLRDERGLYNAVGKQLDGVGEIVQMSRNEACQLASSVSAIDTTDDDIYRRYLIYKILKNTSNCSYYDIMQGANLFWPDAPIRYSEDPSIPATIIFGFDAKAEYANKAYSVPFIKAGGVSLLLRMNNKAPINLGTGIADQLHITLDYVMEDPGVQIEWVLTDETGAELVDELGHVLIL